MNSNVAVVVHNGNEGVTFYDTIHAIKDAGFKKVFIQWYYKDWIPNQEEQLKYIRDLGIEVIFAHLEYQGINNIWLEGAEGDALVDKYKRYIKVCHENSVPMVIMHVTSKYEAPLYNELGIKRLKEIADYAKELNIKIAFENTKIKGYQEYIIDNIDNDNVGICFDSGHYHLHFNDELNFDKFNNRIFALHLHDNDQSDDCHWIPFDGTLDWDMVISNLRKCHYDGPITMELRYKDDYIKMGIKEFYKNGYEAGCKLDKMLNKSK